MKLALVFLSVLVVLSKQQRRPSPRYMMYWLSNYYASHSAFNYYNNYQPFNYEDHPGYPPFFRPFPQVNKILPCKFIFFSILLSLYRPIRNRMRWMSSNLPMTWMVKMNFLMPSRESKVSTGSGLFSNLRHSTVREWSSIWPLEPIS